MMASLLHIWSDSSPWSTSLAHSWLMSTADVPVWASLPVWASVPDAATTTPLPLISHLQTTSCFPSFSAKCTIRPTPTATRMASRVSRKPTAVLTRHPLDSDLLKVVMSGSTYLLVGATVTDGGKSADDREKKNLCYCLCWKK